ncbi:MAG: glycosyltransferase family 39 protein [Planctomycetia bacterium]|nr:glycosyltransferase family 39 protein [Planctomycetia bacterium]
MMQRWLHTWWEVILLAVFAAWLLFNHLDGPLLEPDESRYAEIPRLMLRTGDWITPKLQGKPYNDKPPLVYWLIAFSYQLFGISITSARLVPAVAGFLTLGLVYFWTRRYFNRTAAGCTVVVMLSMLGYAAMMRMLLLDGVLTFLVLGALLSGHHALAQGRHPAWWLLSAFLCGLGVLAKGPVALVLVTPCLFALRWLDRNTTPLRLQDTAIYGIVALLLAGPWYLVMLGTNEHFGSEHFLRHHLQRFLDPAHHERPIWYYIPTLLIELLPWPLLLYFVIRRWRVWTGTERFVVFFCLFCFLFFSAAGAKLPTYLLPILPMLAVLIGTQLQILISKPTLAHAWAWTLGIALIMMLFILTMLPVGMYYYLKEGTLQVDEFSLTMLVVWAGCIGWQIQSKMQNSFRWVALGFACLMVNGLVNHRAVPMYARQASIVEDCEELKQLARLEQIPCVAHRNSWDAVSFDQNGEELEVFSSKEWPAFIDWLQRHPRCMVWMRDYKNRIDAFTDALPETVEVEQTIDKGRVQAIIIRSKILNAGAVAP